MLLVGVFRSLKIRSIVGIEEEEDVAACELVRVEQRSVMRHCCVAPTLNDASRRPKDSILSWKVNLSMGIRL